MTLLKSLAKVVTVGAAVTALTVLGMPGANAGPTGPVLVPGQLPVPSAEAAYSVVPAHCENGQNVPGVVIANPVDHAKSRLGGELATTASGYGPISLEYISDADYSFPNGPLVSIIPSPNLGSVQDCTPPDADGDKVADSADQCPATPAGATVDVNGCAASQKDSDGDHVVDSADLCPGTLMGVQVDVNGCALPTVKEVTPLAPTATDHTITIPSVEGVIYTNGDGEVLTAGTYGVFQKAGPYHVKADGTLTVLAKPAEGYTLTGLAHYMWPFVYKLPTPVLQDTINSLWVTICHAPNSDKNPYKEITVNANAILHEHTNANGEQESGHASHERDVIPSFPYIEGGVAKVFPGLNDDAAGEDLLMHECETGNQGGVENPAPGNNDTPPADTTKPEAPVTGGDTTPVSVSNPETPQVPAATDKTTTDLPPAALANVGSSIQTSDVTESNRTGTIADAETAVDGGSANWFAIAAGFAALIVAAFHKKVLRRS